RFVTRSQVPDPGRRAAAVALERDADDVGRASLVVVDGVVVRRLLRVDVVRAAVGQDEAQLRFLVMREGTAGGVSPRGEDQLAALRAARQLYPPRRVPPGQGVSQAGRALPPGTPGRTRRLNCVPGTPLGYKGRQVPAVPPAKLAGRATGWRSRSTRHAGIHRQ